MSSTERPKPGQVEERRAELDVDGRRIRGVIPYSVESREMPGGWREIIEPTALRGAKLDELIARVDHQGVPIGRFPKTLDVEDRSDGLHWSVDPPASRADLIEAIDRGDLQAGSWQMVVDRDRWVGDTRHVEAISELRDVSIVSSPAYPASAIEYRAAPTTPADAPEEVNDMSDEVQNEGRSDAPENAEERKAPEVKIVNEPEPVSEFRMEDRVGGPQATSLAELYEQRGFFENRVASVDWDEFRAFTWAGGTVLDDLNPLRREGVGLGYDRRWLYPVVPTTSVDAATTSVQYLRQSSRDLAGTAVIRPLDAVTQKPETSTTAELQTLQLSQVATVSSNIPRIHAAQPMFQSLVEQDLRTAIGDGLDEVVRRGVTTAGTAAGVTGNVLDKVRKAKTVVEAEGYVPNVLAIDPAGAEALDLLRTDGTEAFYVFNAGAAAPAPYGLEVRVWKTAGTALLDTNAFGRLYVSPLELRSFEADGGLTNRQNVRLETNAGFTVERSTAAVKIN